MKVFRIPKARDRTRWVNPYNLLKLTKAGNAIASVIDYAIGIAFSPSAEQKVADFRRDIEVTVFPAHTKAESVRDFYLTLKQYDDEEFPCEFVETSGSFLHYAPDGRIVVMETKPIKGSKDTAPAIELYFENATSDNGPKTDLIRVGMNHIVQQPTNFKNCYVVYCHTLSVLRDGEVPADREGSEHVFEGGANIVKIDDTLQYIGITKQGWQRRFNQHLSNARRGSPLLFHRALRDYYVGCKLAQHIVLDVCLTEKEAMDAEEKFVSGGKFEMEDAWAYTNAGDTWYFGTLYPKGLNMIPGGYAGLKMLHKLGALKDHQPVDVDRREQMLLEAIKRKSRTGIANPLISAHWNDPDYATKIICGPEGRLSPGQIQEARTLELTGKSNAEIAKFVSAKNEEQIDRLLRGKTYSRIGKPS